MLNVCKALNAPGVRSACAVACGVMLSGLMAPTMARAEDQLDQLDPLVVTATRVPQRVSQTMADVTVISREVIERQVAGGVADVLRDVPGIQITRNGDAASTTSVMIRGSNARHVLVLVDGVPVGSQASGGATWESLPLAWVDHIEVVRGPASVAYGSDAMGGVIQIFTRKGRGAPHVELGLGLSDQSLLNGDVSLMGGAGDWDYALGVAAEASHGFNSQTNTVPGTAAADRDGHTSNSEHLKLGWQPVAGQRVQWSLDGTHVNNQFDAYSSSSFDDRALKDSSQTALSWSAQWTPLHRSELMVGQSTDAYDSRTGFGVYQTSTRTQTASVLNHVTVGEHQLRLLVERREDHLLNSDLPLLGSDQRGDQADNGVSLGYGWQSTVGGLSATWRRDDNDRFGAHTTGSLSGSWVVVAGQRLRASVGTAFRSPTIYQMFSTYGDPSLRPETSRTRELGYSAELGGANVGLTAFHTDYDQLIDFGPVGTCLDVYYGCYRNTTNARIQGLSLTGDGMVGEVRLIGSIDWLNPTDVDQHKWLARRARQEAKLRAEWAWSAWQLGAQAQLTGRRYDDAANAQQLGGYALYGADASRKLTAESSLVVRVSNLSNHAYQTAYQYASEPRTVFLGWRWAPTH